MKVIAAANLIPVGTVAAQATMRIVLPLVSLVLLCGTAGATDLGNTAEPAPVATPPATTQSEITGYGELGVGMTVLRGEFGFTSGALPTYSGGGYLNLAFDERWNLEVEGHGNWVDWAGDFSASDAGAFAHLYWRDPQHLAAGGFVGYTGLGLYGMQGTMWTAGAEAQAYFNMLTFYGQAGFFNSSASSGWLYFTGGFVRGTARAFVTPNLRLQLDAQWAQLNNSDQIGALTLIGTVEYRLQNSPLSGFASVRWDQLDPVLNQKYSTTRFLIGMRSYFGNGSLFENDRRGAPMDVLPFPPLYALNFG